MALFNVTLHGVADPFEFSTRQHPAVGRGTEDSSLLDEFGFPGKRQERTVAASSSRFPPAAAGGEQGMPTTSMRKRSSGDMSHRSVGTDSPPSSQRNSLNVALINAPERRRPKSSKSAALRAGDVTVSEGLVLPPVPGALPPVSTRVRGNTAVSPRKPLPGRGQHNGSHEKMMEMRLKHRYSKQGPNDTIAPQLTTTQSYGRWMRTCMPQDEQWTQERRRGIAASEITKFVSEMALTNKDFSLF